MTETHNVWGIMVQYKIFADADGKIMQFLVDLIWDRLRNYTAQKTS